MTRMRLATGVIVLGFSLIAAAVPAPAQQAAADRLPTTVLDVMPPSARVHGVPGNMRVHSGECRPQPASSIRGRIVDIAAQEWGFFGFRTAPAGEGADDAPTDGRRRRPRFSPAEGERVATTIAGYWAVTAEGSWIVARQNDRWKGPDAMAARWNAPWSAAFISWVMCEAGLATTAQFQRAIAHHAYIDQAIRHRDGRAAQAAFMAYDAGEAVLEPGDLVCSSRRPMYRTLAERRRQLGVGARSHCDIVVKVDVPGGRVFAIGGNVRGVVAMKQLPLVREGGKMPAAQTGNPERPLFAHLKLRAPSIDTNALDMSPTLVASARPRSSGSSGSH